MATRHPHARETVADRKRRIDNHLPVTKWIHLKSAFYALLLFLLALVAIRSEADPTVVFVTAATALLVVYGVEINEVEIAGLVSIILGDDTPCKEDDDP